VPPEVQVVDDESKLLTPVDDVFAAAFDQLTEETPKAPAEPDPAPAVKAQGDDQIAPPAEPVEPPVEPSATPVAAAAAEPDAQVSKGPQIDAAELARQIVEASRPKEPVQAPVDNTPALFSAEELAIIDQYQKDFPDIAKAEAMVRRAEYRNVVSYVFQEITKELRPLVETVQLLSSRVHLGDIQRAVPDYAVTRDQAVAWVEKQPGFLQPGYKRVIEQGTADEVAELISLYKAANPSPPAQAQTTPAAPTRGVPPKAPVRQLDTAAKAALAALTPVATKRTNAAVTVSADDFEGAFEEASKLLANVG
jgi:hypothetical protein